MITRKTILSVLVALSCVHSNSSFAGGGGVGVGSTEVTQYLNFGKLSEQVVVAAQQAQTMIMQEMLSRQNLMRMAQGDFEGVIEGVANRAGQHIWTSAQQSALQEASFAAGKLADSAETYGKTVYADYASMRANGVDGKTYADTVIKAAEDGDKNAQEQIRQVQSAQEDLRQKSEAAAATARKAAVINGTVEGLQVLIAASSQGNQIAVSSASVMNRLLAQAAAKQSEEALRTKREYQMTKARIESVESESVKFRRKMSTPLTGTAADMGVSDTKATSHTRHHDGIGGVQIQFYNSKMQRVGRLNTSEKDPNLEKSISEWLAR